MSLTVLIVIWLLLQVPLGIAVGKFIERGGELPHSQR
jgi:hypothetical protein